MKTTTRCYRKIGGSYFSLDRLMKQLQEIRSEAGIDTYVELRGDEDFGYTIALFWDRPMTEEEITRDLAQKKLAEEAYKEARRKEYEKLKKEFDE